MGYGSLSGYRTNRTPRVSALASSGGYMGVTMSGDMCGSCSSNAISSSRRVVKKAAYADVLLEQPFKFFRHCITSHETG
jgi:hypothetical protein